MKKLQHTVFTITFLIFITTPVTILLFKDVQQTSYVEKRQLAQLPELAPTIASIQAFPGAFENFFNDHYGLRTILVKLYNQILVSVFQTSPKWCVVKGKDGWLFFAGDSELADFTGSFHHSQQTLNKWKQTLVDRKMWLNELGISYLFVIPPNKSSVYPEYLPMRYQRRKAENSLSRLMATLATPPIFTDTVDLTGILTQAKGRELLYHKSDTHWNQWGSYAAYQAIMTKLTERHPSLMPLPLAQLDIQSGIRKGGDLALMLNLKDQYQETYPKLLPQGEHIPARWEDLSFPTQPEAFGQKFKEGQRRVSGTPGQQLTAILISDSFGAAISDLLAMHFQKITHILWARFEDVTQFIATEKPDVVIDLAVARSLSNALGENVEIAQTMMARAVTDGKPLLDVTPASFSSHLTDVVELRLEPPTSDGIGMQATGTDPQLHFTAGQEHSPDVTTIMCRLSSSNDTDFTFYYQGIQDNAYSAKKMVVKKIKRGENTVLFRIYEPIRLNALRVDPGAAGGRYVLHRLVVAGSPTFFH